MNTSDIEAIKKNYTDLLIRQYQDKPKAKAIIEEFVSLFLQDGTPFDLMRVLDVETQIGKQLDLIGKIVGVDRAYTGFELLTPNVFFALGRGAVSPTSVFKGFSRGVESGGFLSNKNSTHTLKLNDDDFRVLLKLKIIFNFTDGSEYALDNALFAFFRNDALLSSDSVGTIKYTTKPELVDIFRIAAVKKILPKPMGISVTVEVRI